MRPIAVIDCETDPFKYGLVIKPFIWGVYYDGRFQHFKTFLGAINWLSKFDKKMVVYAHNAGRFDYVFKEVVQEMFDGTMLKIIHGRLAKFKIGDLEFRDSLCAVPVALSKYEKSKFAYWKMKKQHRAKYMPQIITYLESDCKNLYELINSFVDNYGPSLTLAGASLKQACKIEDFESPKSTAAYFRDLKPFYYGGHVAAPSRGVVKGPIYNWDINSAYPFAMQQEHPWGAQYHKTRYKGGAIPNQACLVIECESRGAFPYGEVKFGTTFPDDGLRRKFKVTGWEYNAAKDLKLLGKNPRITTVYKFPKTQNFKKYVNHFYDIRKKAADGSPEKLFGKLFMNSLYGRFGLDGSKYEQYQIAPPSWEKRLRKDGWMFREEAEDGRWIYFRPEPKDKWHFHDVATALSVTGCVRAIIMRTAHAARKAGSTVHYIDTDGIKTTGPWRPKDSSNALGAWKLEEIWTTGYFGGKKLYAGKLARKYWKKEGRKILKWKVAHKGVVLTPEEIVDIAAHGKTVEYFKDAPSMGILSGTRFIHRKVRATN